MACWMQSTAGWCRLEHYRERLREITDMAVREREHAD